MVTYSVKLQVIDSPDSAPNYDDEWTMVKMEKAFIVCKGTQGNKPTIDIQLKDEKGNKYLMVTTGRIMEAIAGAIKGARERTESE